MVEVPEDSEERGMGGWGVDSPDVFRGSTGRDFAFLVAVGRGFDFPDEVAGADKS